MANTLYTGDDLLELDPASYIYRFSIKEFLQVAGVGAVLGLATPLLGQLISHFVVEPFFCRSTTAFSFCAEGGAVAFGISLIILSVAGLLLLASLRTYQPLLNVVAALASLWGLDQFVQAISSQHSLEFNILCLVLFAFAYCLFYLLLRIRNFAVSLALILIMVILVRLQF